MYNGVISQIVVEKNGSEIVYLKVGKKVEEITIDSQTKVKNSKGILVSNSKLKKGEKVKVDYRIIGKYEIAKLITLLS